MFALYLLSETAKALGNGAPTWAMILISVLTCEESKCN